MRNQWEEQRSGTSKHAPTTATKPELRGDVKQEKGGEGEGRTSTLSSGSEASTASKRPIPEWSGCVEGTKPQLVKRRRLNCDHCGECVCVCMRREAVCVYVDLKVSIAVLTCLVLIDVKGFLFDSM